MLRFTRALFMLGRALTSVVWGIVADRYGRKPVILIGTASVVVFNTMFGLSLNFWMAIITRFCLGSFNGLLGPIKAYAMETLRDEYQGLALSAVSTAWGIGLIIVPAIGGYLAQSAKQYPSLFSQDSIFGKLLENKLVVSLSHFSFTMDRVLFYVVLLTFMATETTSTTIYSPDGDIINCTDIYAQRAFEHPLLKHHKIQKIPVGLPNVANKKAEFGNWQIWHNSGMKCPGGTIPVRSNMSLVEDYKNPMADKTKGHEHAVGSLDVKPDACYGSKFTTSVHHPKVDAEAIEFSLGQIWLASGSYETGDLQTLEVGWQVFPGLYFDSQPRLFIFWTNDSYTLGRCYNLRCAGFIQTSRNVLIEGAITLLPTRTELTVQIWKDPALGHWWLSIGPNNATTFIPVGYWPVEVFANFTHAETVQWGGEIARPNANDHPEMGSGYPPNSTNAAYMRDLEVLVNKGDFQPVKKFEIIETYPEYFRVKASSSTSFTYGGPAEGPEEGEATHFGVSLTVMYFCFGLFLFI